MREFVGVIVAVGLCIYAQCSGATEALTWAGIGAAAGAAQAAADGGNILLGAFTGFFAGGLGAIGGWGGFLASGTFGGAMTYAMGGKFGHGFISAGVGSLVPTTKNFMADLVIRSVVGGTVSEITGGKFANGASSAAVAFLIQQGASMISEGGDPQDRCSSEACGSRKKFTEEEKNAIKLRINEIAKDELAGSYTTADGAALAIHNNEKLQQYLTKELGIEGWAVIDGSTYSIKEISTGFNTSDAAGVYDSTFSKGDYIWHSHPSGLNVHGGDLYSAWNKQASGIYASGKNLSYMQSNSAGTGGFFKTTDEMRDYRGKYSIPMRVHMDGRWRNAWSDEQKY